MEDFVDISLDETGGNGTENRENCTLYQNEYCETPEDYEDRLRKFISPDHYEWALIVAHFIVFLLGLVGNALVCVAVFRNTSMRTVTNYFIVNLAVADFLVILICLPPTVIWDVTATWFLGEALCKIVLYFQTVSVSVSVLTLTVISVERWYAICYPLKFKATTSRAKRLILLIWVISLIVDIPELIVLETRRSDLINKNVETVYFTSCAPNWNLNLDMAYIILRSLILYAVPLMFMSVAYYQIVKVLWSTDNIPGDGRELSPTVSNNSHHNNNGNGMTYHHNNHHRHPSIHHQQQQRRQLQVVNNGHCNTHLLTPVIRSTGGVPSASSSHCSQADYQLKSRRKAAKMLVAVVIVFAMCYLPVHYYSIFTLTGIEVNHEYMTYFAMISHWLCYANSAINPLIYNFMSGKFRREFARAFQCICFKKSSSPSYTTAASRIYTYNITHRQRQNHQLRQANGNAETIWC